MVVFLRLANINVIENFHHVFVAEGERENWDKADGTKCILG